MNRNDLRSQSLDLLRFPLAVIVLIIHVFTTDGLVFHGVVYSFNTMPILLEINNLINGFLRGQSVPIYFFISGFVFFLDVNFSKRTYFKKLKNRCNTLLFPYIIWNTVAALLILIYFLPFLCSLFPNIHTVKLDFSIPAILNTYWNAGEGIFISTATTVDKCIYPQNSVLWFIRDLMIVILCTPILYQIIKRVGHYIVILLGVVWFVLSYFNFGHIYQLSAAFFFFSWGAYMSINKRNMLTEFGRFFKSSIILYPLLSILYMIFAHHIPEISDTLKKINIIIGLLFAYNLSAWLLSHKVCKINHFLACSAFFIYVTHSLICRIVLKLMFYLTHPTTDLGMLSIYTLTVLISIGFLLSVFYLLQRYMPAFLKILVGRK